MTMEEARANARFSFSFYVRLVDEPMHISNDDYQVHIVQHGNDYHVHLGGDLPPFLRDGKVTITDKDTVSTIYVNGYSPEFWFDMLTALHLYLQNREMKLALGETIYDLVRRTGD